jgi:TAG lipase/steryl ester hydrolase/phospholipase A2/LPA acyltransferase
VAYNGIITPIQERRVWKARLEQAGDYDEWAAAASELDRLGGTQMIGWTDVLGKDAWKVDSRSGDYDYELVQARLQQLESAHEMGDAAAISFLLRTSAMMHTTLYL